MLYLKIIKDTSFTDSESGFYAFKEEEEYHPLKSNYKIIKIKDKIVSFDQSFFFYHRPDDEKSLAYQKERNEFENVSYLIVDGHKQHFILKSEQAYIVNEDGKTFKVVHQPNAKTNSWKNYLEVCVGTRDSKPVYKMLQYRGEHIDTAVDLRLV